MISALDELKLDQALVNSALRSSTRVRHENVVSGLGGGDEQPDLQFLLKDVRQVIADMRCPA